MNENRAGFRLADHPWITLPVFLLSGLLSLVVSGIIIIGLFRQPQDAPFGQFTQSLLAHFLLLFLFVPFVLRLPKGKTTYKRYLHDIGLTTIKPFFRLLLLALTCYLILMCCQVLGSAIYRVSQDETITAQFIRSAFDVRDEFPPRSWGFLLSLPSIFEEAAFRGVLLTCFLVTYSKPKAILLSSFAFGIIHALNFLSDRDPLWVTGQVTWAFILGLFYGYLFIKTGSLLPVMLIHYLGNISIASLNGYIQQTASVQIQVLYGVTFTLGIIPVVLMILWVKYFTLKWPFEGELRVAE